MGRTVQHFNPATGEALPPTVNDEVDAVPAAISKARLAQEEWANLSYKERAKHVWKIQRFLADNKERAVDVISSTTGKTRQDAISTEVLTCLLACEWYAKNTAKVLKPRSLPNGSIVFLNKGNTLYYEPIGVVGIISPWNYPFSTPFIEVIMALMSGNGVILKVASNATHVGNFIDECIRAGELPEGLFQHLALPGAEAGPAMLSGGIDKLFFTGSVGVGKTLMAEAAKTLTPLSLELGGNDSMVVLADASVERAVNCACWAGYQNAGQSCGGVERIFVHESIYDEFVEQLAAKTAALRHGFDDGTFQVDMGSLTTQAQYNTIKAHVDEAVSQGAKIIAQSRPVGDCSKGIFYPATVLTGCTTDMRVMREETFGPILPVVPFRDEEEAIRMANGINLALTNSVFSKSSKNAQRVAKRLQSGVVSVNDHLYSHGISEAPWGGWKESGLGRTHGYLGLEAMVNVKCVNTDAVPSGLLPRNLWWYPFTEKSYKVMQAALVFIAPKSFGELLGSLKTLLTGSLYMFKAWRVDEMDKKEL